MRSEIIGEKIILRKYGSGERIERWRILALDAVVSRKLYDFRKQNVHRRSQRKMAERRSFRLCDFRRENERIFGRNGFELAEQDSQILQSRLLDSRLAPKSRRFQQSDADFSQKRL